MANGYTLPVVTILQVGQVAQYLAANDIAVTNGLFGGSLNPNLPLLIYMERSIVQWQYDRVPENTTLRQSANYLWQLYGAYSNQALAVINGSTGGGIIPGSGSTPEQLNFIVDGSTPIVTGQNTKTFAAFVGYNLLFARGGVQQSTIQSESSWYSWNKETGIFVCYPAAFAGDLFQITPY